MNLGDLIREYRESHNLSQRQFATNCGLSNGYISMLEKGVNPKTGKPIIPNLQQLKKLADGMNMTTTDMLKCVEMKSFMEERLKQLRNGGRRMDFDLMRQRLVQAREFCGYNRKQFASVIGIPYRTITNYENGAREPGSEYITKVADICGCTTDWLLGLTESAQVAVPSESAEGVPQADALLAACTDLNATAIERVISYAEDLAWNPANKKG